MSEPITAAANGREALPPVAGDRVVITRPGADNRRVGTVRRVERVLCGEPPIRWHRYPLRVHVTLDPRGDAGPERRQFRDADIYVVGRAAGGTT
ncbi:MAG: hypothetical protein ACRD1M_06805 [Terriglobales bacterium]